VVGSLSPLKRPVKNARRGAPAPEADLVGIEPIKRTRIPEEIASRIRALIVGGSFKPDQPLPSERALAKRMRVSRGSVRDALRRLEVVGLLETRHGQGTFLHELSVDNLVAPMASVLTFNRVRQDDLMDVRRVFEPAVAGMAATRATAPELDEIDRILEEQRRRVRAGQPTIGEDTAFHAALARATHNLVIVGIMETLNDLLIESRTRTLQRRGRPLQSLRGHEAVVEAMRRRDGGRAAIAMRQHIDQIAALLGQGSGRAASRVRQRRSAES
jgi:GntR family transcriptional repressor for pyruvate dehydrogenase complex